jgi:hypothetical protein
MPYLLLIERERKKKKGERAKGLFSQGRHALLVLLCWDFPGC